MTEPPRMANPPGYRQLLAMTVPIIAANSATPMLGLVDTAVIGNLGTEVDLGAIALGSLLFNFLFWGFGFLRMGTSGFVAQAVGRRDDREVALTVLRGLLLAFGIGVLLVLLQWPLAQGVIPLFGAGEAVQQTTRDYFQVRIWGAPACLGLYVLMGNFIGSGASRVLLLVQLVLNGLNILLDILFAGVFGLGAPGIALGTVLAEWSTLGLALWLAMRRVTVLRPPFRPLLRSALRGSELRRTFAANGDILLRTLALLAGFAIFTDQGARFGDHILAANHILLQLISFSAFFLDGFAFSTEALAGRAYGAGNRSVFTVTIRRSSLLAGVTAAALSMALLLGGPAIIAGLTDLAAVRAVARQYLPFCALYVLISFPAFQLDGIFIGTTQTLALRNAAIASTLAFMALAFPMAEYGGNTGLWSAFIAFVALRAVALASHYRRSFSFAAIPPGAAISGVQDSGQGTSPGEWRS